MHGFECLVHMVNTIKGCPIFSWLISIRPWAFLFNITIIQAYAPTSNDDYEAVEDFYKEQKAIEQTSNKGSYDIQVDQNANAGRDAYMKRKYLDNNVTQRQTT